MVFSLIVSTVKKSRGSPTPVTGGIRSTLGRPGGEQGPGRVAGGSCGPSWRRS